MADCWRVAEVMLVFCLMVSCFLEVQAKRTKEKIYIDLTSKNSCIRLLNGTHQIGCSSDMGGNTGVVYYMETEDDWKYVLSEGTTSPYVPVIESNNFTAYNVRRLVKSGRVTGIVVITVNITSDHQPEGFSADKACPNEAYGMYQDNSCRDIIWNPVGHGLLFDDLDIPIFSLTEQSDVDNIIQQCWIPFNKPQNGVARTYPLCAMQLMSAMAAAKDSETCIRRSDLITNLNPSRFCDALGDKNVVATLKAVSSNEIRANKSVIIVATRVDTMSLFYNEYPSADTTVTGIVALLATAKALWAQQEMINNQPNSLDVMFVFFQGEAFDYIGSTSMLYEIKNGRFPVDFSSGSSDIYLQKIHLKNIAQFVELSQVGNRENSNTLFMHVDPDVRKGHEMDDLLQQLVDFGAESNTTFKESNSSLPLPPSSLQRFLMEVENKESIPSFVITDHSASFTNKYYNSRLDLPATIEADYPSDLNDTERYDANTVQSERITSLATALARYLFFLVTGSNSTTMQADRQEVNHMLYCFLHSPHCELFNSTINPDDVNALNFYINPSSIPNLKQGVSSAKVKNDKNKKPYPFYVTVKDNTNEVTSLIQRVLAYYMGTLEANATKDSCSAQGSDKRYNYYWMHGSMKELNGSRNPVCYKSTVLLSKAESPAFDIDGYDWDSGTYSTWTESRWEEFSVRVFLIPSKQFEVLILTVGLGLLLVSLVAVYFINSNADILFQTSADPAS